MEFASVPDRAIDILKHWANDKVNGIEPLTGDASNRSYFRVRLKKAGKSDRQTVILMVRRAPEGFRGSEEKTAPSEGVSPGDPFVVIGKFLEKNRLPVPAIHYHSPDGDILIQEDLGDETLSDAFVRYPDNEVSLREKSVELLLDLQSLNPGPDMEWMRKRPFSRELYVWEFDHFLEYGVNATTPADIEVLKSSFSNMSEMLAGSLPGVLLHRDYHSRNLMLDEKGDLTLIDFQDMRIGSPLYDLSSFLFDAYRPVSPALLDKILFDYEKEARKRGIVPSSVSALTLRSLLATHAFQRNLKACGRFFYIDRVKGNPAYLASVPQTHKNLEFLAGWEPSLQSAWSLIRPLLKDPADA